MTTMYVSWHKWNRVFIGETTMQTEGPFISSEAVTITSGGITAQAPGGAEYAEVWADAPFYFLPSTAGTSAAKDTTSKPYPANAPVQVPGVVPAGTRISGIAI